MRAHTLFVVDDEGGIREGISLLLGDRYVVQGFPTAERALERMGTRPADIVLLDIVLPGMTGIEALRIMRTSWPDQPVIMITAHEDIQTVVSAMRIGAYDFIVKPLQKETLEVSIRNALESVRLRREIRELQERQLRENYPCFIGESDVIQDLLEFVGRLAKSAQTPVMILGETGTGKELIARHIHMRSPHSSGSFVAVNCSAIPMDLFESELFGYEKGAFTGASGSGKRGLVEEADGGTLFLDEIGDLDLKAQSKLLRFLEEGEFFRVGGPKKHKVQTRVISATNRNLRQQIEKGLFREDLYYRLAVAKVEIPSLTERREDILMIATAFLREFSQAMAKSFEGFTREAGEALMHHPWRGNVRELKNYIERAVLIGEGPELGLPDLGLEDDTASDRKEKTSVLDSLPRLPLTGIDIRRALESLERHYIEEALRETGGNESRAAALVNLNHQTFRYRKKRLGL